MPTWTYLSFQDSNSPFMEQIMFFHDHAMIILVLIVTVTMMLMVSFMTSKNFNKFVMEGQEIETIWTIMPALMLVFIALPSLKTLYLMEESNTPSLTIKVTGHQWYWTHEHSSLGNDEMEMFMEESNTMRLMKTSETMLIPQGVTTRILVTSSDVIHSWTIPSMGVKTDAVPGRLNQVFLLPKRLGLFSGQCSEICGSNHSFMPISVTVVSIKEFIKKLT